MATAEIDHRPNSASDQARAIASLPADIAILKLENETIQSLAAARPRDHVSIRNDIVAQLDAYPSFAKAAIYAKPCGMDPETGKQKIARGLSIRAAEALAEAYGYCRIRCDVSPVDDDTVKVEATFTDYQKGRIWQDAGLVSKWYKSGKKNGYKMVKHADDRFYGVVVKAEASRRIREVITRSVPPGLRAELQEMAERRIATLLDDREINKIIGYFGTLGVSAEQIEEYIGRTVKSGWTEEDRLNLHGLAQAIRDGETTVADAFADSKKNDAATESGNGSAAKGPVNTENLTKPKAAPEKKPDTASQLELATGMARIRGDFAAAETTAEVETIYNLACGPDSTLELTQDEAAEIEKLRIDRKAAIRKARDEAAGVSK